MDLQQQRTAWLAGLKPGDEVATPGSGTPSSFSYNGPKIGRVARTTKTQIVVTFSGYRECRFRMTDGLVVGSSWSKKIVPATDAVKTEIVEADNRSRLSDLTGSLKKLTGAQIAAMLEAYDRVTAESQSGDQ